MDKRTIKSFNSKGQHHGYQEWYWDNGDKLRIRGYAKHGQANGYQEWYSNKQTNFYIR
jgi:hypothetical protein